METEIVDMTVLFLVMSVCFLVKTAHWYMNISFAS